MNIPDHLSDQSRVWIFPAARPISSNEKEALEARLQQFFSRWASHGDPVPAAGAVIEQQFVVVAVDEALTPSGCSIDSLFREVKAVENELQIPLLDSTCVFARVGERVLSFTRQEFRRQSGESLVDATTPVYDTTASSLAELRSGRWVRPAGESWHKQLLETPAAT